MGETTKIAINPHTLLKARMSPKLFINILGWTGSILYLLAYALVSMKKTEGDSILYQGINIFAGILLVIYTLSLGAYATTGLNAVWVAIGLFTLGRKWLTRN
jgi:O-antigen ligase